MLLDKDTVWQHVQPDTVLQLGGHITSKRITSFLEWCSLPRSDRYAAQGHLKSHLSHADDAVKLPPNKHLWQRAGGRKLLNG